MQVRYRHGSTLMIDFTSPTAVPAGAVVDMGGVPVITHSELVPNIQNAVAAPSGTAVYEVMKAVPADVFAAGDSVDVDLTLQAAALDGAGDMPLGRCVKASSATDATVWVQHVVNLA